MKILVNIIKFPNTRTSDGHLAIWIQVIIDEGMS